MAASPFPPELSALNAPRLPPPRKDPRAEKEQVGRHAGAAYPFGPTALSAFGPKDDIQVIATSIANIITTPVGSIPYAPQLGSTVPYLLWEPLDDTTLQLIRHFTEEDLANQEPRILINSVQTDVDEDALSVRVSVGFQIVGDPNAQVYNVPLDMPRPSI